MRGIETGCLVLAWAVWMVGVEGARPRIAVEGQPDADMPPNEDIKIPEYVQHYDDETFFKVLKANDVVVMYLREQHCPDCDFYAHHFYNATGELHNVPGVSVGQIDIREEGDIFEDWHGVEEDIPSILVFKTEETVKYRKKPIQFVVNSRVAVDLAPFVNRMLGPAYREVPTENDFKTLLDDGVRHADSLVFAAWTPPDSKPKHAKIAKVLLGRIAEAERFNTFFAHVPQETPTSDPLYANFHNHPSAASAPFIVSYVIHPDGSHTQAHFEIPLKGDFKQTFKTAQAWVTLEKTKRVGHKYDKYKTYYQEDLFVPGNYTESEKLGEEKHYVKVRVHAKTSTTKMPVINEDIEFVTHEKQAMNGIERGLSGMSVGMTRMLVLPSEWREGGKVPVDLPAHVQMLTEITLLHIGPTNELPGRIEWETDPEKIAEYRRKSAEQEKQRKEAIERGEDPDAQCKADKEASK